jgi:hypothetical protein
MRITKEHYRDFIGTLAHKKAEVNTEMKAFEHYFERGDYDSSDECEYRMLQTEWSFYDRTQKYFMDNHEAWTEFETLDSLKAFVCQMKTTLEAMEQFTITMLPEDGGELIGTTYEEWDKYEDLRYKLRNKCSAWLTFADFCEYGHIE